MKLLSSIGHLRQSNQAIWDMLLGSVATLWLVV